MQSYGGVNYYSQDNFGPLYRGNVPQLTGMSAHPYTDFPTRSEQLANTQFDRPPVQQPFLPQAAGSYQSQMQ